jgi:hypothetical protein
MADRDASAASPWCDGGKEDSRAAPEQQRVRLRIASTRVGQDLTID